MKKLSTWEGENEEDGKLIRWMIKGEMSSNDGKFGGKEAEGVGDLDSLEEDKMSL